MTNTAASCFGRYYVPGSFDCKHCSVRKACLAATIKMHKDAAPKSEAQMFVEKSLSDEEQFANRVQKKVAKIWADKGEPDADSE